MAETQFTPGPYSQHPYSTLEPMLVRGGDSHGAFHFASIGIGSGEKLIAEVRYEKGTTGGFPQVDDMAEFRANAALFIAAPDLLEALTEAEKHFGPFAELTINGEHDLDDVRVVALMRAALAKALGK